MTDWETVGNMTANNQNLSGAEYSGSQLGSPNYAMKFKGCATCHANVGGGTDTRIVMTYMHNPNNSNYSISFSKDGVGITYRAESTIYTNAATVVLDY